MRALLALLAALPAAAAPAAPWPPELPVFAPFRASPPAECLPDPSDAPTAGPKGPQPAPGSLEPAALPLPADDLERASAVEAARRTRAYWLARPADEKVAVGPRVVTAARLAESLETLAGLLETLADPAALKAALQARFDVYEAAGADGARGGTITAYYDPELPISKVPGPGDAPVYARPADLVAAAPGSGFDYGRWADGALVPYWTRREISDGALDGRGLALYWTPHASSLNLLQTQGSGWGVLPDGARRRLAFDGANGRPFHSVGKALRRCGLIAQDMGAADMLAWLRAQPAEREKRLVALNPRYVFLKERAAGGPWGASGVELTAGRSIAVDTKSLPLGLPGLLVSRKPVADADGRPLGFSDFTRFVFAHDVGAAIRGAGRVDVFWGSGRKAEAEAFRMLFPGRLYVLLLKP